MPDENISAEPKPLDGLSSGDLRPSTAALRAAGETHLQDPPRTNDPVNHPRHYTNHPSGIECIQVVEYFNFNLGNAIKYIWRAGEKGNQVQDLEKAAWYLNREIQRLKDGK